MFRRPSLERQLQRAQRKLAGGDFEQAQRLVAKGLEQFPQAEVLLELELTIRRAQAREGMQSLRARIARDGDPRAYEELIELYLELGLQGEARSEVDAYASKHPRLDTPHLLAGEMHLQGFFEDLIAREAHQAHRRLRLAGELNPDAIRPWLLLAELYYCTGADRVLGEVVARLEQIAPDDEGLEPLLEHVRAVVEPGKNDRLEGLFERIEVEGALVREPTAWPLRSSRRRVATIDEDRAQSAVEGLVSQGSANEVVLLLKSGALIAHATQPAPVNDEEGAEEDQAPDTGLVDVTRTVARTISRYAREFDLGGFKRCTIQGKFGLVAVGRIGGAVAGARWPSNPEPQRLWSRVTVGLEGALGREKE